MAPVPSRALGYDANAPRRPVNLTLNSDLLKRMEDVTPNLSATVETLLGEYLAKEVQSDDNEQKKLKRVIKAVNRFHEQNGFLSDEFSTL